MNIKKYDRYYNGEWPYDEMLGVGLSFEGKPTDYKIFLDILQGVSCNPISARRILDILESGKKKYVTVMRGLDFNSIGDELKGVGVKMEMVEPYDYNKHPEILEPDINNQVDREVLLKILNKEKTINLEGKLKEIYEERLKEAMEKIKEKPHNYGLYDR